MGKVAPFVTSSIDMVRGMLRVADVKPSDVVYDLGSGDGRIVIEAVQEFKARKSNTTKATSLTNIPRPKKTGIPINLGY